MAAPARNSDSAHLPVQRSASATPKVPSSIWLNGGVLACVCPDCAAPMSIRLWLRLADCWSCGTSVELSEEQEREAQRLLQEQAAAKLPAPTQAALPTAAAPKPAVQAPPKPVMPRAPQEERQPAAPKSALPVSAPPVPPVPAPPVPAPPAPKPQPVVAAPVPAPAPQVQRTRKPAPPPASLVRRTTVTFSDYFRDLPSWLSSLILHMVALIVLSIIYIGTNDDRDRVLVLSTQVGPQDEPGGQIQDDQPEEPVAFEDAGAEEPVITEEEDPFAKDGQEDSLLSEPFASEGELISPLEAFGGVGAGAILKGRDPTLRGEIVRREGGTIYTEAAVTRGLEWLARHQFQDGHWGLHDFHTAQSCRGQCSHPGTFSDNAATALALLPFLGAGQTHNVGDYKDVVKAGLAWLVSRQKPDGDLRGDGEGAMYAHGQASIVLCEAYALTRDPALEKPAQLALDFIVRAQHAGGGWRYQPGQLGDTSVVGWQLMALRSGQMAYLKVPYEPFPKAMTFLDTVQTDTAGGMYTYMPGMGTSMIMSAEALLCRMYAGWRPDHKGLVAGTDFLLEHPPQTRIPNMYYWYYATQVMHHVGGTPWKTWNAQMSDILVSTQETKGHEAGSWRPWAGHDVSGGRIYMTSLAVCTLEVYYRHMPLYRNEATDTR